MGDSSEFVEVAVVGKIFYTIPCFLFFPWTQSILICLCTTAHMIHFTVCNCIGMKNGGTE